MKTRLSTSFRILSVLCLAVTGTSGFGQAPVIVSFSQNGELVCTNLVPGSLASVEWAASLNGPWTNTRARLAGMVVDSSGTIRVSVPMFYRVRSVSPLPAPTNMVWIPPGTFMMGSPTDEPTRYSPEGPQTVVTISRGLRD